MKTDSSPDTSRFPSLAMERNNRTILLIRGQKVILDADLAALYGVPTKAFNQAVKRNRDRFPLDFMFRLTPVLPLFVTEHGAIMPASVLNSPRAIAVSVYVVRAFTRLGEAIAQVFEAIHELM